MACGEGRDSRERVGPLEPGTVHVWTALVDARPAVLETLAQTLNASEIARTEAFRFERHRVRHLFRRGMLRALLGQYVDTDPARLVFEANAFGKPSLAGSGSNRTTFNLSHSGEIVVVAIANGPDIGVDVEAIRPVSDIEAIAQHYFAPTEHARIAAAPAGDRDLLFLRLWTRKEACVKAVGRGLSMALDSFDVSAPDDAVRVDAMEYSVSDVTLPAGYVGALAVQLEVASIECREWHPRA